MDDEVSSLPHWPEGSSSRVTPGLHLSAAGWDHLTISALLFRRVPDTVAATKPDLASLVPSEPFSEHFCTLPQGSGSLANFYHVA